MAQAARIEEQPEVLGHEIEGAASIYTRRARFFDPSNAFAMEYPAVPPHTFVEERDRALDPATETTLIPLDLSATLELPFAATSPLVLAAYARIRAGESLRHEPRATTALFYVIEGSGESMRGGDHIAWSQGDVSACPAARRSSI